MADDPEELEYTRRRAAITSGLCPECGYRGFVLGPRGGESINIECGNLDCRRRYNVVMFGGTCVFYDDIPKESEGGSVWPSEWRGAHS